MPKAPAGISPNSPVPQPSESTWKGASALGRMHALNERCLEVLAQLARTDRERVSADIVNRHRNLWYGLDAAARKRAASTPFLLMDVHFQDADWWRWARNPRLSRRRETTSHATFAGKTAVELMRETVMLAWRTTGFDRGVASVLLGMTPAVSTIIDGLDPQDIERIAARHNRCLRLRWEDFPVFWHKLLTAARDGNRDALHEVHLHGMQLLGGEVIPLLSKNFVERT